MRCTGADHAPISRSSVSNGDGAALFPTNTIHGPETFSDWYNDVPGVSLQAPLVISLDNEPDGMWRYESTNFVPIDNQLFGNQGRAHNDHFTCEFHAHFVYRGGEQFTFVGDDDFWLFIDDQRVIDLGGVQGPQSGEVNLDLLGLVPGYNYCFDLFSAQRYTPQSNWRIATNIDLEPTPTELIPPSCKVTGFFVDASQETVAFLQLATDPDGEIVSYHWDFGDGQTSSVPNPTHIYTEPGEYEVELCVTDNDGLISCCGPSDLQVVATEEQNWGTVKSYYR